LEKKQKDLKNKLILKKLLGILKLAGQVLSFTGGPIGMVGNGIKEGANMIAPAFSENNSESKYEIPSGVKDSLNRIEKILKDDQIKIAKQQFQKLSDECKKHPQKFSDIIGEINKVAGNQDYVKIVKVIQDKLEQKQKELEENLKKPKRNDFATNDQETTTRNNQETLEILQNLNNEIKLVETAFEVYNEYQKDKEKLDKINDSIKQAEEEIKKLQSYEENIHSKIMLMVENMQNDIINIGDRMDKKSHVFLDLTRWQVQASLKDMKFTFQQIVEGFPEIKDYLVYYMEKLDEGMTTIINLYDRIQDYYDQAKLTNYIANISSPMITEIEDKKLKEAIEDLEQKLKFNIILGHYKKAISAFRQWVFPFAYMYSNVFSLQLDNSKEAIDSIVEQISHLKTDIKSYNATINQKDGILVDGKFGVSNTSPFFVWENKKYSQEISELLNGEEVIIKAYVKESDRNKSAIKFNKIEIRFKSIDKAMQNEIDSELKNFDVTMIHLGNSYYRYGDKFYVIRSDQAIEVYYSFKKDKEGPVRKNTIYKKINMGDIMLSPYTMWKIKLKSNSVDFSKLKAYKDNVDLELIGHGTYVHSDNINKDYYQELLTG
ncbi:6021_t:CDS:1, partial [Dentiscutata heterogama]